MAGLAEEIEKIFPGDFHGSMDTVPQETRHIILLYHQVRCRSYALFRYPNCSSNALNAVCDYRNKAAPVICAKEAARKARS